MAKTNAQLQAELEAARAEIEALRTRSNEPRARFTVVAFHNEDATAANKQPEIRSTFRIVAPENVKPGDPIWLDLGLYYYDPATCPLRFDPDGTLPELTGSVSYTSKAYADEQEAKREAALKRQGRA